MKVLITEDELGVAQNLVDLIEEIDSGIEILGILQSVKDTVSWIETNPAPDLAFLDIRLADGNSFEIFEKIEVQFPVVFTTAYDEYALQAFKVNSIDYLLKPIDKEALQGSLDKYESFYNKGHSIDNESLIRAILELRSIEQVKYKRNFLIYHRERILPLSVDEIAYFYLSNEMVRCCTHGRDKYYVDQSLDKIEGQIDPKDFFRANRQYIISRKSVISAGQYFQRKLKLDLKPPPEDEVVISKTRSSAFKKWLEGS